MYDNGWLTSQNHPSVFTLCVGNLSVGGSGKTPTTEWLVHHLRNQHQIAVLSRGYGRETKGFLKVNPGGDPKSFGDEPLQMANKFPKVPFFVCEDRVKGVQRIVAQQPEISVVILDDAFQHRKIRCDYNLLLTPFQQPYFRDELLPSGSLRDIRDAASRSDVLLVTKSPEHVSHETKRVYQRESGFTLEKDMFFTHLRYGELINPETEEKRDITSVQQALLVSGLANPQPLVNWAESHIPHLKAVPFRDHHPYRSKDIRALQDIFNTFANTPDRVVITTEKDYVKLSKLKHLWPKNWSVFIAPITIGFNDGMDDRLLKLIARQIDEKREVHGKRSA